MTHYYRRHRHLAFYLALALPMLIAAQLIAVVIAAISTIAVALIKAGAHQRRPK